VLSAALGEGAAATVLKIEVSAPVLHDCTSLTATIKPALPMNADCTQLGAKFGFEFPAGSV